MTDAPDPATGFVIRKGETNDLPALHRLISALATFENAPDAVTNTVERMRREASLFDFFVAEIDETIVGAALYFFAYYSWVGKSLYLDDLFVKPEHRGKGIGTALIMKLLEVADTEDCQRVRWQVLDWNQDAIGFYQKLGAEVSGEWLNCDLNRAVIERLAQKRLAPLQ